jgi:hypothetical protein
LRRGVLSRRIVDQGNLIRDRRSTIIFLFPRTAAWRSVPRPGR